MRSDNSKRGPLDCDEEDEDEDEVEEDVASSTRSDEDVDDLFEQVDEFPREEVDDESSPPMIAQLTFFSAKLSYTVILESGGCWSICFSPSPIDRVDLSRRRRINFFLMNRRRRRIFFFVKEKKKKNIGY